MCIRDRDKTITDKMLFWATKPKFGTALDPVKEKKRIEQNQVLGKKINSVEVLIKVATDNQNQK